MPAIPSRRGLLAAFAAGTLALGGCAGPAISDFEGQRPAPLELLLPLPAVHLIVVAHAPALIPRGGPTRRCSPSPARGTRPR